MKVSKFLSYFARVQAAAPAETKIRFVTKEENLTKDVELMKELHVQFVEFDVGLNIWLVLLK